MNLYLLDYAYENLIKIVGRNEDDCTDSDDGDASQTDDEDEVGNDDGHGAQPDNGDQFNPYGTQYLLDTIWNDPDLSPGIKEYPYNDQVQKDFGK